MGHIFRPAPTDFGRVSAKFGPTSANPVKSWGPDLRGAVYFDQLWADVGQAANIGRGGLTSAESVASAANLGPIATNVGPESSKFVQN